jgi:hypothetical protein
VFAENTAEDGGGAIYINSGEGFGTNTSIRGCHIIGNSTSGDGGGLLVDAAFGPDLEDTLFCGNTPNPLAGNYVDMGGNVFVDACGVAACCMDGICVELTDEACQVADGLWLGSGLTCDEVDCADGIQGACCLVRFCSVMGQGMCDQLGGVFHPLQSCSAVSCDPSMVNCVGDTNTDGNVNIDDLLQLMGNWGACP